MVILNFLIEHFSVTLGHSKLSGIASNYEMSQSDSMWISIISSGQEACNVFWPFEIHTFIIGRGVRSIELVSCVSSVICNISSQKLMMIMIVVHIFFLIYSQLLDVM